MIIATEVIASAWAVRLTATGATGTVDWYRSEGGSDTALGSGATVVDRGCRLNTPITYWATDDIDLVVAPPVTVAAERPVLSSTVHGTAREVTVIRFRPYSGEGRSVWHDVIGRTDPPVSIFPAVYPSLELVLRIHDDQERAALIRMLQPGDPLMLRSVCPPRLDDMTVLMRTWSDPFPDDSLREGPGELRITCQRTSEVPPAWTPPADRTYQTVLDEHADYQSVLDGHTTYQALLDGLPA